MTVTKTTLPENSILNTNTKKYDYADSFRGVLNDKQNNISSGDVGKAFFMNSPEWIDKLFALRDKIASVSGLKTSDNLNDRQQQLKNFKCEPGEQLGLFKVFNRTDKEVILGEDDKHLNFRVSLFLDQQINDPGKKLLTVSTTVEFNNWFGRLYFLPVRPFHKLIVPAILKGIIKSLENRNL